MLHQLAIRNFAIIDHLQLEWHSGLNVLTGETGAGKSIIIDAVGALLGDRLGPEVVRSGATRALVEGVFAFDAGASPDVQAVLDQYGLEPEDGALIVTREVAAAGGRGGARINGRAVPLSVLQELGERLVDVHGQSQHMALLRPREQLEYLDRYANLLAERATVAALTRELRATREARQRLLAEEREAARLHDVLRHEVAEIERADLQPDEEDRLQAQRNRLQHVERLRRAAQVAHSALSGEDDTAEAPAAIDLLARAVASLGEGVRFDDSLAVEVDNLNSALAQAEESARALRDYVERLEADPDALERTAERLFRIADLKRKYGDSVAEVLAYAADARRRLEELEHRAERASGLEAREQELLSQLGAAAAALSARRRSAAQALSATVERELAELRLAGAHFCLVVTQTDDPVGLPLHGRVVAFDTAGVDRVEFQVASGPGEEPRPIARVASGGELARIALALKTILARVETRPTLIFDEIDVGVGGRTAPVVGEKLWRIAAAGHQVLCVTHMPQVAAFASHHLVVTRAGAPDSRAETRVSVVDEAARVDELAAMLGGELTQAARLNARELLSRARARTRAASS
ncbi:MAG: DNA repair protein RecN [Chloroflexota bacterium]|nr:DNA repair protein RecN [Chloroflexota bacterium]